MSEFDLIIRNGTVIDGTGAPARKADVAVSGGRIATVGAPDGDATREIDATGHVVCPGFIDAHTHMDAQVFWDPSGSSPAWNGVTTVVMGNCGFTLAPAKPDERMLVIRNLERAEDISPAALAQGVAWSWESFADYLDAVEATPKAINYSAYVGHSALRTWAMGERAFEEEAGPDDLERMSGELRSALQAGAIGLSTSRSDTHLTSDDRPVASRVAAWDELRHLAATLAEKPGAIFQVSVEQLVSSPDPAVRAAALGRLTGISLDFGVPVTFGILAQNDPYRWQGLLGAIDEVTAAGGRMFGQSLPRQSSILMSFLTRLPFDPIPEWAEMRARPLAEQRAALLSPEVRRRLIDATETAAYSDSPGAMLRRPDYDRIRVLVDPVGPNATIAEVAAQRGVRPIDAMIDLALETDMQQLFAQGSGNADESTVLAMLRHPHMIPTFSDSGAHVGFMMESAMQTYLLACWARRRGELSLEQAVAMVTNAPARAWGFTDRGVLREGFMADINILDPDAVQPGPIEVVHDLPGGGMRLIQRSIGISSTLVAGEVTVRDGVSTGVCSGRLVRH